MKKRITIIFMLMTLLLAGCASAAQTSERDLYNSEIPAAAPAMEESFGGQDAGFAADKAVSDNAVTSGQSAVERIVIRNADLSIVVDDPGAALNSISRMSERMGGFVVSSNLFKTRSYNNIELPEASITVRVPADLLNQALDEIKGLTSDIENDVVNENVSGQDVTKEYTDLNSRLANLEDAEAQLRLILEEAKKTEDVLNVFNQLTYYREQIEVTKGQIKYYEESASLSAISVRIQAHEAVNPITVAGWKPSVTVSKALQSLVNAMQFIVDSLIWIILAIIPVMIVIILPLYLIFLLIRSWVRRSNRKKKEKKAGLQEKQQE